MDGDKSDVTASANISGLPATSAHAAASDDTAPAPTPADETTILADEKDTELVAPLAWADAEPADPASDLIQRRRWAVVVAVVVLSLAAVAAAGIEYFRVNRQKHFAPQKAAAPTAAPLTKTEAVAAFRTALPACYDRTSVTERPSSVGLLCQGHWIENLTWSSWGPDAADGVGMQAVKDCVPSCATGALFRNRVEVHFSGPAPPPMDSGCPFDVRYYTQLIVAYPE